MPCRHTSIGESYRRPSYLRDLRLRRFRLHPGCKPRRGIICGVARVTLTHPPIGWIRHDKTVRQIHIPNCSHQFPCSLSKFAASATSQAPLFPYAELACTYAAPLRRLDYFCHTHIAACPGIPRRAWCCGHDHRLSGH